MKRMAKECLNRARPFIIIAALLSLCVSDNVGPCFLPMPLMEAAIQSKVLAVPPARQAGASHVPSRERTAPDRVEMAAPTVQRSSVEGHTLHLLTVAPDSALYSVESDRSLAPDFNKSSFYSAIFVSSTPGRAPPRTA